MSLLRGLRGRRIVLGGIGLTLVGGTYYSLLPTKHTFPPPAPGANSRPPPPWNPPSRSEMLNSARKGIPVTHLTSKADLKGDEEFDLLIVGGGATGAGVAVDAASRGLKVALVERDDFSSGTCNLSVLRLSNSQLTCSQLCNSIRWGHFSRSFSSFSIITLLYLDIFHTTTIGTLYRYILEIYEIGPWRCPLSPKSNYGS